MTIACSDFGRTSDGKTVSVYTLRNRNGVEARITNYGGILVSLRTPDRFGQFADVVLGFDSLDGYLGNPGQFFGCLIGRYANRIGHAKFTLGGIDYSLDKNDGLNSLHGGARGFDKQIWDPRVLQEELELTYLSKDGEGGFPGNLKVAVLYRLSQENELSLRYRATADKDTVINLTSHFYFNLRAGGDILDHRLAINADRFTPVSEDLIPTGELRAVDNSPFDFRSPTSIGSRIEANEEQLTRARGYDHNWALNSTGLVHSAAARVEEPTTGRILQVRTTEPGIQFYSGNFLDGAVTGKAGQVYGCRTGFCLETQHFPDSPNKPNFPSTLLEAGEEYRSATAFRLLKSV